MARRERTIATATDARITATSAPATDDLAAHDEVKVRVGEMTLYVDIMQTDELGTWANVYLHSADGSIVGKLSFDDTMRG